MRKHATVQIRISKDVHALLSKHVAKLGHPHTLGSVVDNAVEAWFRGGK
jgi:hypothetical protein